MGYTLGILGLWLICGLFVLWLKVSFNANKVRLLNGLLFACVLCTFGLAFTVTLLALNWTILLYIWIAVVAIGLLGLALLLSWLGVLLLWNAWLVWRRESHSLGNLLTLFIGLYIVISPILFDSFDRWFPQWIATGLRGLSGVVIGYFVFWLLSFCMSFFLYRMFKPAYNQAYIIVLGAGLLNGTDVSPLLKSRINVALQFGRDQAAAGGALPVIVMSGGQGPDEVVPEGRAMRDYALSEGYPSDLVLAEEASTTTYENMLFSKQVITEAGLPATKGIFATSDYHVFRAAGYARAVELPIDGIGAKTRRYFVYNALLREYIALLANHKRFHMLCLGGLLLINLSLTLVWGYSTHWR